MHDLRTQIRLLTSKPIVMTLDGFNEEYDTDAVLEDYCLVADIIGIDRYPCNRGEFRPWLTFPTMYQRVKKLAPGKRIVGFLETCDGKSYLQDWAKNNDASGTPPITRMHPPAPLELVGEAYQLKAMGVERCYFPHVIGKSWESFDGTTPQMLEVIKYINANI
jgi:hypothetical protein